MQKIKKSNLIATDILHVEDEATEVKLTATTSNKDNEDDDEGDVQENVSEGFYLFLFYGI